MKKTKVNIVLVINPGLRLVTTYWFLIFARMRVILTFYQNTFTSTQTLDVSERSKSQNFFALILAHACTRKCNECRSFGGCERAVYDNIQGDGCCHSL